MAIKKFDQYIKESRNNSYLSGEDIPECLIEILDFIKNKTLRQQNQKMEESVVSKMRMIV